MSRMKYYSMLCRPWQAVFCVKMQILRFILFSHKGEQNVNYEWDNLIF